MSISTLTSKIVYNGNGSTTLFPFTFKIFATTDLVVTETIVATGFVSAKTITTHYTVTTTANDFSAGGTVTMGTAPATGVTLTIYRDLPDTQSTDYVEGDAFPAESHEDALDKLTMLVQEQREDIDRSVKIPLSDTTGTSVELPIEGLRASSTLVTDADGNISSGSVTGITVSSFMNTVLDDTDAAVATRTIMAQQSEVLHLEGAANQDETIRLASDATLMWDESEDEFVLDKSMRLGTLNVTDGVKFPTTFSNETNANTLDDYEEGTFTPTFANITAGTAEGRYTKIGRIVYATVAYEYDGVSNYNVFLGQALPFTVLNEHACGYVTMSTREGYNYDDGYDPQFFYLNENTATWGGFTESGVAVEYHGRAKEIAAGNKVRFGFVYEMAA